MPPGHGPERSARIGYWGNRVEAVPVDEQNTQHCRDFSHLTGSILVGRRVNAEGMQPVNGSVYEIPLIKVWPVAAGDHDLHLQVAGTKAEQPVQRKTGPEETVRNFVPWRLFLRQREAFLEHDSELAFHRMPFAD